MFPFARGVVLAIRFFEIRKQLRHLFGRPNVEDRHLEELVARVPVMIDCCLVDCEKLKRCFIAHVHRTGIRFEQQPVLVVLSFERCFGFTSFGHIANDATDREAITICISFDRQDAFQVTFLA